MLLFLLVSVLFLFIRNKNTDFHIAIRQNDLYDKDTYTLIFVSCPLPLTLRDPPLFSSSFQCDVTLVEITLNGKWV